MGSSVQLSCRCFDCKTSFDFSKSKLYPSVIRLRFFAKKCWHCWIKQLIIVVGWGLILPIFHVRPVLGTCVAFWLKTIIFTLVYCSGLGYSATKVATWALQFIVLDLVVFCNSICPENALTQFVSRMGLWASAQISDIRDQMSDVRCQVSRILNPLGKHSSVGLVMSEF